MDKCDPHVPVVKKEEKDVQVGSIKDLKTNLFE